MKTYKEFMLETDNKYQPDDKVGNWEDYVKTNFNPHIGEEEDLKKGEKIPDMHMRKVISLHTKIAAHLKPIIRKFLNNPLPINQHLEQDSLAKKAAGYHPDFDVQELDKALTPHTLKVPTTIHIGLTHLDPTRDHPVIRSHFIGSTSPDVALNGAAPQGKDNITHILRVDLEPKSKYALVGDSKDSEGNPVAYKHKNTVIIPRGGRFKTIKKIEQFKDKDGNLIHVHSVKHLQ